MDASARRTDGGEDLALRRVLSTRLLALFVLGDILGAGIYALVGEVGAEVGGAIWAAFATALALATLTAFAYAELATKYPQAAGSALYVDRAYGVPFVTFMVGFAVMSSGVASAATLARAFAGEYLAQFVALPTVAAALGFLVLAAALNLRGIAASVRVNVVLTTIEVLGLALIVVLGVAALGDGQGDLGRNLELPAGESAVGALVGGAVLAFYALIGFEDSVNVAEETRDPTRAFPRALFGGLAVAGAVYLAVTVVASAVVPTGELAASSGPLLEVVDASPLDVPLRLFAAIALLAVANGALINMIMASRLVYGMARRGVVPAALGRVLPGRRTPWAAILLTTAITLVLASTGEVGELADTTVLLLLAVFAVVNVTALALRREAVERPHFRAPTAAPVLGAVVSAGLVAHTLADDPADGLRAGLLLVLGAGLWLLNRRLAPRARRR